MGRQEIAPVRRVGGSDISAVREPGHLFVVGGDLTRIAADHRLVPTDANTNITEGFEPLFGDELPTGQRWQPDEFVRRWKEDSTLWLARIGEHGARADPERCARAVRVFAESVASDWDFESGPPTLAIPALGTGHGGNWDTKGLALEATIGEAVDVARRTGVDICLVCNDRQIYSAAQRVRRRRGSPDDWRLGADGDRLRSKARDLAAHAQAGELTFFLGAGVSTGVGLPTWSALLADLGSSAGMTPASLERLKAFDFRDQATVIQRRYIANGEGSVAERRESFVDAIRRRTTAPSYSLVHGLIASLRSREVVTTNYDTLYEEAVSGLGQRTAVLPYEAVEHGEPWLLKLHGCIDRPESIVLTRGDYLGVPASHGALFGLVQAMLLTRHMVFVGYSLSDEDFHHLVDEVRRARPDGNDDRKLGSVLTLSYDEFFEQLWSDDVDTIPMDGTERTDRDPRAIRSSARKLAIFLDFVCHEAADSSAFLGDDSFSSLLDETERDVARRLSTLRAALPDDHAITRELAPMLERFGF